MRYVMALLFVVAGLNMAHAQEAAKVSNPEAEQAALAVAKDWLGKIDQGEYAETWAESADYFRNMVTEEQWEQAITAARAPLGDVVSRTLHEKAYMTEMPGAPDGEYVVIIFKTEFVNKKNAIETIAPMKADDGSWRVSGYFIK